MQELLQAVGVITGLLGQWLIIQKRPAAFGVWMVSNAAIIGVNLMAGLYGFVFLFTVYFALCIYGYAQWRRSGPVAAAE